MKTWACFFLLFLSIGPVFLSWIKSETIDKGRIWAYLTDNSRVFGESLPMQKSNETKSAGKNKEEQKILFLFTLKVNSREVFFVIARHPSECSWRKCMDLLELTQCAMSLHVPLISLNPDFRISGNTLQRHLSQACDSEPTAVLLPISW